MIVSGISIAQLRAGWNIGSRVGNVLSFANTGILNSNSVLLAVLSKYASRSISGLKDRTMQLGLLATLGSLYQQGKVSLEELITAVINPMWGLDVADQAVGLPAQAALNVVNERLNVAKPSLEEGKIPWSKPFERSDFFMEHKEFFVVKTLSDNVALCQELLANWKEKVRRGSYELFYHLIPESSGSVEVILLKDDRKGFVKTLARFPKEKYLIVIKDGLDSLGRKCVFITALPRPDSNFFDIERYLNDLPDDYVERVYQATEWWGHALGLGYATDDPAELLEEAMDMLEQFQYDQMLTLEEALKFQDRITLFDQTINYRKEKERTEITEGTPVLMYVRALFGKTLFKRTGGFGM